MSVTRWILLVVVAGVLAMLSVYAQHEVSNLAYRKGELYRDLRRAEEEKRNLEARLEAILTPDALASHAQKFTHLVPPGRVK